MIVTVCWYGLKQFQCKNIVIYIIKHVFGNAYTDYVVIQYIILSNDVFIFNLY